MLACRAIGLAEGVSRPIPVIASRRTIGLKADMSGAHASAVAALGSDATSTIAVPFATRFFDRR